MQLTKQTDYAFRVLLYLAQQPEDQLIQMQRICDYFDISSNHISKIIVKLAHLGWVKSVRGKGGGVCLGVEAKDINLADVVREFEAVLKPVNCEDPICRIAPNCTLKGLLDKAMDNFIETLSEYTLADILVQQIEPFSAEIIQIK